MLNLPPEGRRNTKANVQSLGVKSAYQYYIHLLGADRSATYKGIRGRGLIDPAAINTPHSSRN